MIQKFAVLFPLIAVSFGQAPIQIPSQLPEGEPSSIAIPISAQIPNQIISGQLRGGEPSRIAIPVPAQFPNQFVQQRPNVATSQSNIRGGVVDGIPNYEFSYMVNDPISGDIKSHSEMRQGNVVKGVYSVNDPDGIVRTVQYTVDGKSGFRAVVSKQGTSRHPIFKPRGPRQPNIL